jgi:hypothetical protein
MPALLPVRVTAYCLVRGSEFTRAGQSVDVGVLNMAAIDPAIHFTRREPSNGLGSTLNGLCDLPPGSPMSPLGNFAIPIGLGAEKVWVFHSET